jgi:quercetin dioxygenase-like cupin family protein
LTLPGNPPYSGRDVEKFLRYTAARVRDSANEEPPATAGKTKEAMMNIVGMKDVPKKRRVSPLFTGEEVTFQPLIPEGGDYNMNIVNFGKGIRNKFHFHESDQILIVTAGSGIVATEHEQRRVTVGDVILFPKGEKHWHGATEDSEFSHIYITKSGGKTIQVED